METLHTKVNRIERVKPMEFKPSFDVYKSIIRDIKKTGKGMSYAEAIGKDEFVIMRHDIEFSIDRAYALSLIESEEDFNSTYFVQITNNSYNAFSKRSLDMLKDMADRGHTIGLHYHLNGQLDPILVRDGVRDQLRIMSEMLGREVNTYSFHRPVKEVYYYNISIPYTINAYSKEFFSFAENVDENTVLDVKYIADSKHRWNYGYPDYETLMKYKKIQLLLHPFSWTKEGYDNLGNFMTLIDEKQDELIETLNDEFQRFREVKAEILEKRGISPKS